MGYSSKVAYKSSIVNQNQGGGNKKAGFPYVVGRSSSTSVTFRTAQIGTGKCCTLAKIGTPLFPMYIPCASRPIGAGVSANSYYKCH